MWKKYKSYIILAGINLLVGGLSALLVGNGFENFSEVVKPPFSPPDFLFPIVWTILYILMGISAAMVQKTEGRIPFVYWLQLFVNFFWSIIFFNMQAYLFAFIWLVLLWVLIIMMIIEFYRINKTAGLLQIPYLLWVTFAGYLNLSIWILNTF